MYMELLKINLLTYLKYYMTLRLKSKERNLIQEGREGEGT